MAFENDLFGGNIFKGAAEGFVQGIRDAEDRKFKQMEFDAKARADELQRERQAKMDEIASKDREFDNRAKILASGRKLPQLAPGESIVDADLSNLPVDREYLSAKIESDPMARAIKGLQLQKEQAEAQQRAKGFKLPPDKVLSVQQGAQIPKQLDGIDATLTQNEKLFGPMQGRMGAMNPYDTASQSVDAQLRSTAQAFGRYMEGGVLRKEDEEKYRKMFPQLSDTPDVARNKLQIVRKLLVDKQNADTEALAAQGYDTSGFQKLPDATLPKNLSRDMSSPNEAGSNGLMSKGGGLLRGFLGGKQAEPKQSYDADVLKYAKDHNITPEQAQQIKLKRTAGK